MKKVSIFRKLWWATVVKVMLQSPRPTEPTRCVTWRSEDKHQVSSNYQMVMDDDNGCNWLTHSIGASSAMHDSQLLPHTGANLICQSSFSTLIGNIALHMRGYCPRWEVFNQVEQRWKWKFCVFATTHISSKNDIRLLDYWEKKLLVNQRMAGRLPLAMVEWQGRETGVPSKRNLRTLCYVLPARRCNNKLWL